MTNSSSSSFLLGFKGNSLTQRQKDAIIKYIERNALGAPVNDQRLDEAKNWFNSQDSTDRAKQRRQEGWTVNMGEIPHCHGEYELAEFLRGMWRVMVEADPENAMIIDDDVGYF